MDRSEYLERVRRALWNAERGGITEDDIVVYDGIRYYPCGYYLTAKKGAWMHIAVLHEVAAMSERHVLLSEVM